VNGLDGFMWPGQERLGQGVGLAGYVAGPRASSKKDLQILSGAWNHTCTFRRELLAGLGETRGCVEGFSPISRRKLPLKVRCEFLQMVVLAPLASFNMRSPVATRLSCSDASETGSGACVAKCLARIGRGHVAKQLATALGRGRDLLGVDLAVYAAVERSEEGRRAMSQAWPGVLLFGTSGELLGERMPELSQRAAHLAREVEDIIRAKWDWIELGHLVTYGGTKLDSDRGIAQHVTTTFGLRPLLINPQGWMQVDWPTVAWMDCQFEVHGRVGVRGPLGLDAVTLAPKAPLWSRRVNVDADTGEADRHDICWMPAMCGRPVNGYDYE
ncbi:unnamed protein product, partial [Prorocentrum cordatum]